MKDMALILNLPSEITINILSRLPVKTIISCKCVCKKLINLISSPEFAKFHLSISTPGLLVYQTDQRNETLFRMFEFEDELELQHHDLHYKPVMKFDTSRLSSSCPWMEGSVNGLLCLLGSDTSKRDVCYVCNPITRECIQLPHLPTPQNNSPFLDIATYGFGISVLSGEYKVVRIFHEHVSGGVSVSGLSNLKIECMVYTLGTRGWRSIEPNEVYEYDVRPSFGAFLNGNLHWLVGDAKRSQQISCFDLETEVFKHFPPPFPCFFPLIASLTIVGNCLCLCNFILDEESEIWIMKEYGVGESWTKEFVISVEPDLEGALNSDTFYALKVFKDGVVLVLWKDNCLFYHCKKSGRTVTEIDLFGRDSDYWWIDALLHTPSFVSLRSFELENVNSF